MKNKKVIKKSFCTLAVSALLLTGAGCQATLGDSPVLPPVRIGSSAAEASFVRSYSLEDAAVECDAIARVRIGDWLGENTERFESYFEAEVLDCYKGKLPKTITMCQSGCSTGTLKLFPLFTSGNELLVFINPVNPVDNPVDSVELKEYDSPYYMVGNMFTMMDVSYDAAGTRYFADRYGILGRTVKQATNYVGDVTVSKEVRNSIERSDPLMTEMNFAYPYILSESDMTALFDKIVINP